MKITWIMASRNDGYNGNTIKRLCITISSILDLDPDNEVIVVDFCPQDKLLKDALSHLPIKIITVRRDLLGLLQEDGDNDMPFYEYLAKDIGIKRAQGDYIVACNPDNIFPKTNFDEVKKDLEAGYVVRAYRIEIDEKYIELDIPSFLTMAENDTFNVIGRFSSAAGDFTAFSKDNYALAGGYALAHGSWHLDNLFVSQCNLAGLTISFPYSHYHIAHPNSIINSKTLKERQDKGFDIDWKNYKPISKKLLERIDEFVA